MNTLNNGDTGLQARTIINDLVEVNNYKVYKALLTQTGTSAPVATVLVNTLSGTPVWSYSTVGRYLLTLVGEFDVSKTMIYISNNDIASLFSSYRASDDVIKLECSDLSLVKADDLVNGLPITIEVYP
jgi:hypothetical protein